MEAVDSISRELENTGENDLTWQPLMIKYMVQGCHFVTIQNFAFKIPDMTHGGAVVSMLYCKLTPHPGVQS